MKKNKNKHIKTKGGFHIDLKFTFMMAVVFLIIFGLDALLVWLLSLREDMTSFNTFLIIVTILVSSFGVGVIASYTVSRYTFGEFKKLSDGLDQIANGDFSVRLNLGRFTETKIISDHFNEMAESLASVEILKDDFISDFSHEFKTPLASIKGYISLLNDPSLSAKQRATYLEIINEEIARLLEMSNNTLIISKLNSQNNLGQLEDVRFDEVLRRVLLLSEKAINSRKLTLTVNLQETKATYNKDLLKQIYVNLLSNAIKFSPEGGEIEISVMSKEGGAEIVFKDYGIGMDEETKARIFDKYYQGDPSHSAQGSGLGLSIVKRIVDLSNGTIMVESSPSEGSRFSLFIPDQNSLKTPTKA